MIEIVVNGKHIMVFNGSCISYEDDKLVDLNNIETNLSFDPSQGMPELEQDIIDELPDVQPDDDIA